ncbi:hypothetical protein BDZ97DRAFT_1751393 [Flammula alnicola]|nr:hypothetical protein BDZ97DRAFT_1751393 [Flammula alnicola]
MCDESERELGGRAGNKKGEGRDMVRRRGRKDVEGERWGGAVWNTVVSRKDEAQKKAKSCFCAFVRRMRLCNAFVEGLVKRKEKRWRLVWVSNEINTNGDEGRKRGRGKDTGTCQKDDGQIYRRCAPLGANKARIKKKFGAELTEKFLGDRKQCTTFLSKDGTMMVVVMDVEPGQHGNDSICVGGSDEVVYVWWLK